MMKICSSIKFLMICLNLSFSVCAGKGSFCFEDIVSFVQSKESCNFNPAFIHRFFNGKKSVDGCVDICTPYIAYHTSNISIVSVTVVKSGYNRDIKFRIDRDPCNNDREAVDFVVLCGKMRTRASNIINENSPRRIQGCKDFKSSNRFCICDRNNIFHNGSCFKVPPGHQIAASNIINENSLRKIQGCKDFKSSPRFCICDRNDIFHNGSCFKVKKLGNTCNSSEECTGTPHGKNCTRKENAVLFQCACESGYVSEGEHCLKEKYIYESCRKETQCTKTTGATSCNQLNGRKMCFCSDSFMEFKGRCIQKSLALNSTCELTDQCRNKTHGSVCRDDKQQYLKVCQCDNEFQTKENKCLLPGSTQLSKEQQEINHNCTYIGTPNTDSPQLSNEQQVICHNCTYSGTPNTVAEMVLILVASAGFGLGFVCCTLVSLIIYKFKNCKNIPQACAKECPATDTPIQIYDTSHGNADFGGKVAVNLKTAGQEANPYSQAGMTSSEEGVYNHLRENTEAFLNHGIYDISQPASDSFHLESTTGDYDLAKNVHKTSL